MPPTKSTPTARELREKAATIGASADAIEHARDADGSSQAIRCCLWLLHLFSDRLLVVPDPVKALQDLIDATEQEQARKTEEASAAAASAVAEKAALQGMSVKELRQRATELGINDDKVEEARDSDDPKAALLTLLEERPTQGP